MMMMAAVCVIMDGRLGSEGDGFKVAMSGLDGGRLSIGSCSLGNNFWVLSLISPKCIYLF